MTKKEAAKSFTPSRRLLGMIGAGTFFLAALLNAPASFLVPILQQQGNSFEFQSVSGTIWNGEIKNAAAGEVFLGNIDYKLKPLGLLRAHAVADIDMRGGDATGQGRIAYGLASKRAVITRARGEFNLGAVKQYSLFGIPYQGRIRATIRNLAVSQAGCHAADGDVWTDVLNASSKRLIGDGLVLAGTAGCADMRLKIDLNGANSEGKTSIAIAIAPDMTYQLNASVEPERPQLQENLRLLGFEEENGALVYDAMGALKGAGS